MPVDTQGNMWIFTLNVGQGDTTIIITPGNRVVLIDAVNPSKIIDLLAKLGMGQSEPIEHLVITHPHFDHYSAAQRILTTYPVEAVTLSSIWRYTDNRPGYNNVINTVVRKNIPLNFLSGYTQIYPDGNPIADPGTIKIEMLGPSNQFIEDLFHAGTLDTNHYSIISRVELGRFRMVIAADAQMENWAHFDREKLLDSSCTVLRGAHHGSANGTQYERINRLSPRYLITSSDPDGKDQLPDLIGSAVLMRYASDSSSPVVSLTFDSGTIKLDVSPSGSYDAFFHGDAVDDQVDLSSAQALKAASNPTDWKALTLRKLPI